MLLDELNEWLTRLADANDGVNHATTYALYELPATGTLEEALAGYFSGLSEQGAPGQLGEGWHVRTSPVQDGRQALRWLARHWFYEQEFSPKVDRADSEEVISDFIGRLFSVVEDASVFEVNVVPPVWYECAWQDFAFDGGSRRWLLHLGFSD